MKRCKRISIISRYTLSARANEYTPISRSVYNRVIEPLQYLADAYPNEYRISIVGEDDLGSTDLHDTIVIMCKHLASAADIYLNKKKPCTKLFYDLDDLIYLKGLDSNLDLSDKDIAGFSALIADSECVVCSNAWVQKRVTKDFGVENSRVIRTAINTSKYKPNPSRMINDDIFITNGDRLKLISCKVAFLNAVNSFLNESGRSLALVADYPEDFRAIKNIRELGTMPWPDHKAHLATNEYLMALVPLENQRDNSNNYIFGLGKTPIKYMEYGCLGIPGVYSKHPIYEEVVEQGVTGILVENSYEEWREALLRISMDKPLRQSIIRNARIDVEMNHNIVNMALKWHNLFCES